METPKIDYQTIRTEISRLAQTDLKIISAGAVHLFEINVTNYIKKYVYDYSKKTYSMTMDGLSADTDKLDSFLNLKSGYLVKMTDWIGNTALIFPKLEVVEENVPGKKKSSGDSGNFVKGIKHANDYDDMTIIELLVDGLITIFVRVPHKIYSNLVSYGRQGTKTKNHIKNNPHIPLEKIKENISVYISGVTDACLHWAESAEKFSIEVLAQYQ